MSLALNDFANVSVGQLPNRVVRHVKIRRVSDREGRGEGLCSAQIGVSKSLPVLGEALQDNSVQIFAAAVGIQRAGGR